MVELEKTYLAKHLPEDLQDFPVKEMIDIYIPSSSAHPNLRIRKNGDKYEITRKIPVSEGDASKQTESTIPLSKEEFEELSLSKGKRVSKNRFIYPYEAKQIEIDVFQGPLFGLVLIDVEFETEKEKEEFIAPTFCLVEVTQEKFLAGGMLCGKSYDDIKDELKHFQYKPVGSK
jgi:CYTH domain-containing protein